MLKLTTHGAGYLLDYMLRRTHFPVWDGKLNVSLLEDEPPEDPDVFMVDDFPIAFGKLDPASHEVPISRWAPAIAEDGRAVITNAPPTFQFEVLENFTVFGPVLYDDFGQVFWTDRYRTPEEVTAGGLYQLIVAVVLTDRCDLS